MLWKNYAKTNLKFFQFNFGPHWKDHKSSYHVRQLVAYFCDLVDRIFDWNCEKSFAMTKINKNLKLEVVLGGVRSKELS